MLTVTAMSAATIRLAHLSLINGDESDAHVHYQALRPHLGDAYLTPCTVVDRLLGELAMATGALERTTEHFEEPPACVLSSKLPPWADMDPVR